MSIRYLKGATSIGISSLKSSNFIPSERPKGAGRVITSFDISSGCEEPICHRQLNVTLHLISFKGKEPVEFHYSPSLHVSSYTRAARACYELLLARESRARFPARCPRLSLRVGSERRCSRRCSACQRMSLGGALRLAQSQRNCITRSKKAFGVDVMVSTADARCKSTPVPAEPRCGCAC